MVRSFSTLAALACLGASTVLAQSIPTCSLTQKCPEATPCCSQYGQCGVGAYCLGGCDPRMSFSLDACVPSPVCEDRKMPMTDTSRIVDVSKYLGDPSKADWVAQGIPLTYQNNVILTMPSHSVGTVLASTVYMWYGTVKARMKTSKDAGVVTAFILLSDVKDEIDYEWVGTELDIAQTNYYFQGIPNYQHSGNISVSSNTNTEWHDYEIRWTPEKIEWYVDGTLGRTQLKSKTWNATANQWDFPQTPARVQLSIWPGGADTNGEGTIDWAGGPIDWDSDAIKKDKYYYASVGEVSIECYKADSGAGTNSGTSYTFNSWLATNNTVIDGNKNTILKSLLGSGLNMDADYPHTTGAQTSLEVVPGLSGGGVGTNGQAAGDAQAGGSSGNSGGAAPDGGASECNDGFSQDCSVGSGSNPENQGTRQEHVLGASAFAALIAVGGMLWL
ncbi:putative glycosyl hydrolase family 16 [Rosellinia necatrix]|uniref:Putative glycosyl hydrolase family 16 n=1 Tax=Rosellinia necatrix TaxID=77044 RepID=A0A1W2TKU9_ROSNE|nr:putative glycosyl hydrolase family 16 [Rosellinia necatrix]